MSIFWWHILSALIISIYCTRSPLPHPIATPLIVGGYQPETHDLTKYVVSVRRGRRKKYFGDNHYCGGSIITRSVVLTAAHCLHSKYSKRPFEHIEVVAGSQSLLDVMPSTRAYKIKRTLIHPSFSYMTMNNDIGLLFLAKEIEEDGRTRSIVPLIDKKLDAGIKCTSLGWGHVSSDGQKTDDILYVSLRLFSYAVCNDFYPIDPSIICAGEVRDKSKSVWKGDSGGPLLCDEKITGVISFGFNTSDSPSYFTSVYKHRQWILENNAKKVIFDESLNFHVIIFLLYEVMN